MTFDKTKHKDILLKILHDIYTDSFLAPTLGFKGGTAAMLFYGLPRFSIDLDFDLLIPEQADTVFTRMNGLLQQYGTVKDAKNMGNGLFFILSYQGKPQGSYNIKVDINKRNFGSSYEIMSYLGIPVKVMKKEDMAAHKLVALYQRMATANRDIYDVWFFLKQGWPINKRIVEERMKMPYAIFLDTCISALKEFDDKTILSGLGNLLSDDAKVFTKNKLKNETLFLLQLAREHAS
jgi:predicted nucleotidyltransferase component of viral defense system